MSVKVRFFAQFRELLGSEMTVPFRPGLDVAGAVKGVAGADGEGYEAIFSNDGSFREFVILMLNGTRIGIADAEKTRVNDGDEIAVFPPVAGG